MKKHIAKTALAALFAVGFTAGSAGAADVTIGYQLTYTPIKAQFAFLQASEIPARICLKTLGSSLPRPR